MHSNLDHALCEIKAICSSVQRAEGKVELHDISGEQAYRARMMKGFSQTTAASTSDELVDSAQRKLSFVSDTTGEVLAYRRSEELHSSLIVTPR